MNIEINYLILSLSTNPGCFHPATLQPSSRQTIKICVKLRMSLSGLRRLYDTRNTRKCGQLLIDHLQHTPWSCHFAHGNVQLQTWTLRYQRVFGFPLCAHMSMEFRGVWGQKWCLQINRFVSTSQLQLRFWIFQNHLLVQSPTKR